MARQGLQRLHHAGAWGHTVTELLQRHEDALWHITGICNGRIGVFGEGLGGYVTFYVALARGPVRSIVCQNAPAILTEPAWHDAVVQGRGAARRRRAILHVAKHLVRVMPGLPLPISLYLDSCKMVDRKQQNWRIEAPLVGAYLGDPDFVRRYPLASVMSLVSTPPPRPLAEFNVPAMFLAPPRGFVPGYVRDLFERLPQIEKKLVEVDGSVFWMVSHPREATKITCDWFDETLALRGAPAVSASPA